MAATCAVVLDGHPRALTTTQVATATDAGTVTSVALALGASAGEAADVVRAYGPGPLATAWTTTHGSVSDAAEAALARLRGAAAHGLRPADYLTAAITNAIEAPALSGDARLRRDVALSLAVLRYMRHLHLGRVDPRRLGLRLQTWDEPHDFPRMLAEALGTGRVGEALDGLAPSLAVYAQLVAALAHYRMLAAEPMPPLPGVPATVHAGEAYPHVHALARRLAAVGDLDAAAVPPSGATQYDAALAAAVQRFQGRHGLTPDGAIGGRTLAALQVPLGGRADQIAVALERLRWLPDLGARRVIAVNIPMFRLWAWEAGALASPPIVAMDVIVGVAARRTATPVFAETLDHVIFRPYWNVPPSIVRDEVLPAVRRRPGYLASQQMEIVRGPGDDAAVVPIDDASLAALAAGTLRLRQRPGPHNALGLVKFVFPNRESVYMHGTPAPALFSRDRRDFSHGCIRLAEPARLAAWVLGEVPGWTPSRIDAAMAAATSERATLAAPVDVVLFYLTAAIGPDDGLLHFADDIYGHDAALARALTGR